MKFIYILLISSFLFSQDFYYHYGQKIYLTPIPKESVQSKSLTQQTSNIDYFESQNGQKLGIKDEILVTCISDKCIDSFNIPQIISYKELSHNLYLIKVSDKTEIFTIANTLYQNQNIKIAHPNFYYQRFKR